MKSEKAPSFRSDGAGVGVCCRKSSTVKMKIAQFICLLLLALVTGIFWGTWFSLSRSIAALRAETFLEIGRTMIGNLAWPMRLLFPAALLSLIAVLIGQFREKRKSGSSAPFGFTLAAFALFIAALLITLLVNVPIDNQLKDWTIATLPPDWAAIRDRWEYFHGLRTLAAVAGFASALAAILMRRSGRDAV
jgi:hypothetical protein